MLGYIKAIIDKNEKGQDLAEYALLIGLIALVIFASITFLGIQIDLIFSEIGNDLAAGWDIPSS